MTNATGHFLSHDQYLLWREAALFTINTRDALEAFRDALLGKVFVYVRWGSQTHRGPYVPGGSYTEPYAEYEINNDVSIDLANFDADCLIPRFVEANKGGTQDGRDFDVLLSFDLREIKGGVAVYECSLA